MLSAILSGLTQAAAGASKGIGEALSRGDPHGGLFHAMGQSFAGLGESLANVEIKGFDIGGIGFGAGIKDWAAGLMSGGHEMAAAEMGQKVGRSAAITQQLAPEGRFGADIAQLGELSAPVFSVVAPTQSAGIVV